ncbi:hypothetical protein OB956_09145 [Aeromonas dhakensis]|uniref:hypothetical protein n=1 Tax=Aeromonas dhakensis TaxID=196024 RepID=UPI00259F4A3A|nr:hypothetical protein [Aeromonas dhakensis]MDM5054444.1 hypothetical protein [Aeromonas dhakensis]MDM5080707.1 hypothetical protein [Aeromonas dhakensis]
MAFKVVLGKLIAPMKYLKIFHAEKMWFDYILPLICAVIFTAGYFYLPKPFPLTGSSGLIGQVNGLLQVLIGFYIASLAAVATFQGQGMDEFMDGNPPTLNEKRKGLIKEVYLNRRRFLSYLFGYLALMSLVVFFIGVVVNLTSESISAWTNSLAYARFIKISALFVYIFFICNIFITTLLGLYYLTVRIHQKKGEVHPPTE